MDVTPQVITGLNAKVQSFPFDREHIDPATLVSRAGALNATTLIGAVSSPRDRFAPGQEARLGSNAFSGGLRLGIYRCRASLNHAVEQGGSRSPYGTNPARSVLG